MCPTYCILQDLRKRFVSWFIQQPSDRFWLKVSSRKAGWANIASGVSGQAMGSQVVVPVSDCTIGESSICHTARVTDNFLAVLVAIAAEANLDVRRRQLGLGWIPPIQGPVPVSVDEHASELFSRFRKYSRHWPGI